MKTSIYLASYKGTRPGWQGLVNLGIRLVTRSQYSHSEICIGNPLESKVQCLSSSGVDGGVRMKEMKLSAEKWDVIELQDVSEADVYEFLYREEGAKYDYAGVLRFLLPWLIGPSKKRWFCSEVIADIIGYSEPWRFSPADLHIIASN